MNESDNADEMRAEYDFSKGVRGKHCGADRTGNINMGTPAPRERRLRFSLWNLLVVVTISAFALGLYGARKVNREVVARNESLKVQMATIEEENLRLREEQGVLTIGDKSKIHAIRLPKRLNEADTWTYRVYLPPGRTYFVACWLNDLPSPATSPKLVNSPPNTRTIASVKRGGAMGLESGEYLLTLTIFEKEGKWRYGLQCRGGGTTGSEIRCNEDEWPQKEVAFADGGVRQKMAITTTDEPMKLLDFRAFGDKVKSSNLSHEGVILWVDAVSNYETDFDVYN